jgi:hypothetical protein
MSYQEKNITVELASYLLVLGFYVVNILQMVQGLGLNPPQVFSLWALVLIAIILVNVIASILTNIVLSILDAIKTRKVPDERFIADERDKMIGLRGIRNSYITFSVGVFLAMLTFVFGQPPLVMFSLIVFFAILAELLGDISKLYFYRRGF